MEPSQLNWGQEIYLNRQFTRSNVQKAMGMYNYHNGNEMFNNWEEITSQYELQIPFVSTTAHVRVSILNYKYYSNLGSEHKGFLSMNYRKLNQHCLFALVVWRLAKSRVATPDR